MNEAEVRDALEKLEQGLENLRTKMWWLTLVTLLSIGAVVGMVWRLG